MSAEPKAREWVLVESPMAKPANHDPSAKIASDPDPDPESEPIESDPMPIVSGPEYPIVPDPKSFPIVPDPESDPVESTPDPIVPDPESKPIGPVPEPNPFAAGTDTVGDGGESSLVDF
ncbi:hypothetical protein U1Q18_003721 [Sarracenia purpurea var. burkii]